MRPQAPCLKKRCGLGTRTRAWATVGPLLSQRCAMRPQAVARLLSAVADVEAHEGRRPVAAADIDLVNVLTAFPDSVLPLPAAVAFSASPDGYLTAAAQSALLETFGGGAVAAAAQALAEDMRHALDYAVAECPQEAPERPSPAATDGAAPRWQSDTTAPRTRSSAWEARSGWWSWAQRSGAVGTRARERSGPGQGPARPARHPNCCQGRLVAKVVPVGSLSAGGPLLPQHWAIRGWCRLAPATSSTRFSTWPSRRDPADCRCGRKPPTKTSAADAKKSEKKMYARFCASDLRIVCSTLCFGFADFVLDFVLRICEFCARFCASDLRILCSIL